MSQVERTVDRCRRLIELADEVIASYKSPPPNMFSAGWVDAESFRRWRSSSLAFLEDLLGPTHSYLTEFKAATKGGAYGKTPTREGKGVLLAVLEDLSAGYLTSVSRLIRAEVFTDFLEMAEHLHENGYHHAAVSLSGAVLEDGLREIASAAGVKVNRRDDLASLSSKLLQAGTVDPLRRKELGVWTDLRNAADHGDWDQVTADRTGEMIRGVISFLSAEFSKP